MCSEDTGLHIVCVATNPGNINDTVCMKVFYQPGEEVEPAVLGLMQEQGVRRYLSAIASRGDSWMSTSWRYCFMPEQFSR